MYNYICQKCGSVKELKFGFGYHCYYECPNGCDKQQKNCFYTATSTTSDEQLNFAIKSNSGV